MLLSGAGLDRTMTEGISLAERQAGSNAVRRGALSPRPRSGDAALVSVVGHRCRSLMFALIACALLGSLGWRFFGASKACHPSDLRQFGTVDGLSVDRV